MPQVLAPSHDLDDLAALGELIGDARIVAIGENNHHIKEFAAYRDQVLRYLVTELGFGVLGFESGFAEGELVANWVRGGPGEIDDIGRDGFTFSLGESAEMHKMLTWMREHNLAGGDIRYAGLDVPSSAGSPEPALAKVRAYLDRVDSAAVSFVDEALAATAPYASPSSAASPGRYAALDDAARNAATAALSRLVLHLEATGPLYQQGDAHLVALHHARGAARVDAYNREIAEMMAGEAPPRQSASRDLYMASTVELLEQLPGGNRKIVLMLHNGHLQRTPASLVPGVVNALTGAHLVSRYGDDYFALGLTAGRGVTSGLTPDPQARLGFTLHRQELGEPAPGSVEEILVDSAPEQALFDLRSVRESATRRPASIRHAHLTNAVDVLDAFDALAWFPEMRPVDIV